MATVDVAPRSLPQRYDGMTAEDFETASIISAAPSYISDAPSYHSQAIPNEPAPPYSPREDSATPLGRRQNPAARLPSRTSGPAFMPPPSGLMVRPSLGGREAITNTQSADVRLGSSEAAAPTGLPPIPPARPAMPTDVPNLSDFRIPTLVANPSARHYVRVAQRRAQAAAAAADAGLAVRMLLERVEEEEARRFRPLEDPYLVGEDEARRARERRLAREGGHSEALEHEGRRWDWFLNQTREWDGRDRRSTSPGGVLSGPGRERKPRGRLSLFGRR